MKRLIPLWITALGGFVLIIAYFIPITQGWGEVAAIWFDILAAIAFVLGGGNLLKIHLKKMSNRKPGWGYSAVVLLAFLTMLYVGLSKWGSTPAANSEYYGQTFAKLAVDAIPASAGATIPGATIPEHPDGEELHVSVLEQLSQQGDKIVFRGWMRGQQMATLLRYREILKWQADVETLFEESQPAKDQGKITYYADHDSVAFTGRMTDEQQQALLALSDNSEWQAAVNALYTKSQVKTSVDVGATPPLFDPETAPDVEFDDSTNTITVAGPITPGHRALLEDVFPRVRPMDAAAQARMITDLKALGDVHPLQVETLNKAAAGLWSVELLRDTLDAAGKAQEVDRSYREMYADQVAGIQPIERKKIVGTDFTLNDGQVAHLQAFAANETMTVAQLTESLIQAGDFKDSQINALARFFKATATVGEFRRDVCFAMMKTLDAEGDRLPLNEQQRDLLLADNRSQAQWEHTIGDLFVAAHVIKYPWSGEYRGQGTPYWWLYEYAFKPLQATIFAMLAFYVASAAFRAFRAKNIEAILLLGTAFIILLGRTAAGVYLTSFIPEDSWASGLRIENLTVTIMKVFNTAGNRAIMIGIALGIASTSLKVLLGVDRSYLGSGEE